jgi:hypothetical protein
VRAPPALEAVKGAGDRGDEAIPDFALLCALAVWGAALLIVLGLLADGIVSRLDPRVRLSGEQAW